MTASISDLSPILDRCRTDITAAKVESGASLWRRNEPLTSERIQAHLDGTQLRGVCPIKEGESTTMLALFDLDSHKGETSEDDMMIAAQKVYDEGAALGVYFECFRSSGGRGVHLIAIWNEPQDAYSVRFLMESILAVAGFDSGTKGVAKKEIEIFPKQSHVPMGGCGNQFILPYSPLGQPLADVTWKPSSPVPLCEKPVHAPRVRSQLEQGSDLDEAASALDAVLPEDYQTWVDMGFALKDEFGDTGFDVWDSWSSKSGKYNAREMRRKWNSFQGTGITIASLFDQAMLAGWRRPAYERVVVDTSNVDGFVAGLKREPTSAAPRGRYLVANAPTPCDDIPFDMAVAGTLTWYAIDSNPASADILPADLPAATPPAHVLGFDPLKIPGLIGDTVREIVKYAMFPQPELALLNTLAFAGAVFGRRYASPIKTFTNMYIVSVASTGGGKDFSRKFLSNLSRQSELESFMGSNSIRSDTGLARSIERNPCQLMMLDEYGMLLQSISHKNAGGHQTQIMRVLMSLYSDVVYKHGEYADVKNKEIVIVQPNLCIYGTTTEAEYIKALTRDAVHSGKLNRMVAIKVSDARRARVDKTGDISQDVVDAWSRFAPKVASLGAMLNDASIPPTPTIVGWGECSDLQWQIANEQDDICSKDKEIAPLWQRRHENIIKIAMIFAIARNMQLPEMTVQDFDYAKKMVDASIAYMADLAINHMADSEYESVQQKILAYLKARPKKRASMSEISNRFRGVKMKERRDILADMAGQGVINIEIAGSGKTRKEMVALA